jgi:hypothetical protein
MKHLLKQKVETIAIVLFAILLIYAQFTNNAFAQECNVKVEAPTEISPSTSFNVSIIAENIPDQEGGMAGWEIYLYWTPGVLNATAEYPNLEIWASNSGPIVSNPINNDAGTYHQGVSYRAPSPPVTGTYWLVNITFQSSPYICNTTDLTISAPPGMTYCLVDKKANEIPHTFTPGNVHVVPEFLEVFLLPSLMILSLISLTFAAKIRKH